MIQSNYLSARPLAFAAMASLMGASIQAEVKVVPMEGKIAIHVDEELFTEYHYQDVERPYFYPVIGPNGASMTRNYPVADTTPGEAEDHPHHTGLWFTHGDVNGSDFWHKAPIVHQRVVEYTSGTSEGHFTVENAWTANDGTVVATDTRKFTVHQTEDDSRFAEYEITVRNEGDELVFGDTKEGSMAIRLAATMRLKGEVGQGHIRNSAGDVDGETWGKRAAWCDYYGPVDGNTVGVAIFDHPENPRHPTWWHVRDYGLFAANPFGVSYFEDKPRGTGDLKVGESGSVTWTYGFYFHSGDTEAASVAKRFADWTGN